MTWNNPKLDLVNKNAYIKFVEIKFLYKSAKKDRKYLNLDHVNINAHTKFGLILKSCSQVIERGKKYDDGRTVVTRFT